MFIKHKRAQLSNIMVDLYKIGVTNLNIHAMGQIFHRAVAKLG